MPIFSYHELESVKGKDCRDEVIGTKKKNDAEQHVISVDFITFSFEIGIGLPFVDGVNNV